MPQNIGTVVQIIGAVLDIKFPPEHLPNLLNAIEIEHEGKKLTVEVAQHIGDDTVRCIAMGSTDGLVRGLPAVDTGASIKVPVGRQTLGRIFNLLGEAVDNKPQPETEEKWEIHRPAPSFEEQEGSIAILTNIGKIVLMTKSIFFTITCYMLIIMVAQSFHFLKLNFSKVRKYASQITPAKPATSIFL